MLKKNAGRINLDKNDSSAHWNPFISSEVYELDRENYAKSHGRADR